MTERRPRVMRVDATGSQAVMIEEAAELARVNAELVGVDAATEEEIINRAKDADVVITMGARMTRRVMEGLPRCKAIVRYGIGYDTVDVKAATDNHILVVNIPDFCLEEVSNHALALLLACAKKMLILNNLTKQARWADAKRMQAPMGSIYGETLGIIGCGNIGRMTARKAQCLGLRIIGCDPYVPESVAGECGIALVSLPELLQQSDYVSVHTILNEETRHLIGEKEFRRMKPNAYLINTSRGPVVDEAALIKALSEKWIAGAGLDVFAREPVDPGNPLLKMDNVIAMPHSASYSDASFKRLRTSVGQEAARVVSGRRPENVVNKAVQPKTNLVREG